MLEHDVQNATATGELTATVKNSPVLSAGKRLARFWLSLVVAAMEGTEMRQIFHTVFVAVLAALPTGVLADDVDDPVELADLAVRENPGVAALEQQVNSLKHRVKQASMWMDPMFAVEYSNFPWNTWALGDSPMTGVQVKLQQTITLPGKNDRREAVAGGQVRIAEWEVLEKKNQLAGMVRKAYWRLALVRQLREVTRRHTKLVEELVVAVRARYEVGKAGQHDLIRLELLGDRLEDDIGDFDRDEREIVAATNAALHREPGSSIHTPGLVPFRSPEHKVDELLGLAKAERPLLKRWREAASTRLLAADRSEYERWPDVSVWAGYRFRAKVGMKDDGTDFLSLGLSVPLPIDYTGRYKAQAAAERSAARAAEERVRALLDEIAAGLGEALAGWERSARKAETYESKLLPEARKTLDATFSAYSTDRADFASVYQAELQLLDFDRAVKAARARAAMLEVEVETLVGGPIASASQEDDR